ncbi:MAG: GNAT family N-acetyltransferase [Gemmatimonadetes bacterium]|nr:GNAT family N-acetyltransferase [Gemmatimonadota bacterium]
MSVRAARTSDVDALASLWHEGWQDAHARIVPAELARHRTLESFRRRLRDALAEVRVAGSPDGPLGFSMLRGDELNQFYVSRAARGTGVAARLIADAEERLAADGIETAWLACAIGNERAARFYDKSGWIRVGNMIEHLPTPDGVLSLEVWRYEKDLRRDV